jgi:hypothetical protein
MEEADDGSGRDDLAHSGRISSLRDFWIDQLMGVAAALGLEIPIEHGEFSPHVIRNVFGYLLYQNEGEEAAASYLGDQVPSIRETYGSCDGVHVDVSTAMRDGLGLIKREVPDDGGPLSSPSAARVEGGYSAELALLMQAKNDGLIDGATLRKAVSNLNERYAA